MMLHQLLDPTYKNTKLNNTIVLYKRTKKNRIKNKLFKSILSMATKEKGVVRFKDVVLMDFAVWDTLNDEIGSLEEKIAEISD